MFPYPASGVEQRNNGSGGVNEHEGRGVQIGSGLRQRYGQLGGVSDGHVTLDGSDIGW